MRYALRYPEKSQRPLSDREKMLIEKVKEGIYDKVKGVRVPNVKVLDEYKCPRKERQIVMDEVIDIDFSNSNSTSTMMDLG